MLNSPTMPKMAVKTASRKPLAKLLKAPTQPGFCAATSAFGHVVSRWNGGVAASR